MKKIIYISYYTINTPYEEEAKKYLIPSLKKFNLPYDVQGIPDLGSWQKNTHFKAQFIKKCLLYYKSPIIFLDIDATIEKYPVLFEKLKNYDISYHELDWFLQWRGQKGDRKEILSGTLYLNYTPIIMKFLDRWIEINNQKTQWEQKNMSETLKEYKDKLKTYPLPYEYIVIPRQNGQLPPHIKQEEVIIYHHQSSRKLKNRNNKEWKKWKEK